MTDLSEATRPAASVATGPRPLTAKNYLAYAAGDAGNQIAFTMSGMFLTLYYTNIVGLSGAVIGTMFLVLRLVDAITDLVMGRIIDQQKVRRLGKFRPLILFGFVPLLAVNWLMYAAALIFPGQGPGFYTVYLYVTYFFMGSVFYTIVNISYGAMVAAMTSKSSERAKLGVFRMLGAAVMILVLSWVIAPQIEAFRDDPVALQGALAITVGIVSLLAAGLFAFTVWGTVEQVERDPEPVSFRDSLRALKVCTPLQVLAASSICFVVAQTVLGTLGSYVALYVQDNGTYIAINMTAKTFSLFVVAPLVPRLVATIGKRRAYILLGFLMYVGALLLWLGPVREMPWVGSVAFFLMGLSLYGVSSLMWAMEADTVEYTEWKTGVRTEGTTYAVFSFCRKLGQSLGGFVGGYVLVWAGFQAAEVAQGAEVPVEVSDGIVMWAAIFIMISTVIAQLVITRYRLTEAKHAEIVEEIAARRRAKADGVEHAG